MAHVFNLYIDDSGTRHPDRALNTSGKPDWFALGGLLVRKSDEQQCREMHAQLCRDWCITAALHSEEIRHKKENFRWLRHDEPKRQEFLGELTQMLVSMPIHGIACVIDRVGYHRRYHPKYGTQKWSLCKSAFHICVERAAKFIRSQDGLRMNV